MEEKKSREMSEVIITEKIMRYFFNIADNSESFSKEGNKFGFNFSLGRIKYRCQTESGLLYNLPNGFPATHNADIVIVKIENEINQYVLNPDGKFVSIEIKHKSAVTDAFKARAYDMMHIRKEYPQCFGIMMYIREKYLTIKTAKQYCFPYHEFFGCPTQELSEEKLVPLFDKIVKHLSE